MKYKAVIFDLDGVICHTDRYHYKAWNELAEDIGVPFNEDINNRLRGISRQDSLNIILQGTNIIYNNEEKEKLAEKKNMRYRKLLEEMNSNDLDPEVLDVLESLKKEGLKIAIGSSSRNAKLILKGLGIDTIFDGISDGNNIKKSKPDPEVFIKAAKIIGIDPKDCLVVEDAKSGVLAAIAGGMDCAAIGDAVKSGLAQYNLSSIKEIMTII